MNKGRLYEELIPIEQLSYKGYNTPELANAKVNYSPLSWRASPRN
jgi:hypothetical protein